jgi:hypothetical protein
MQSYEKYLGNTNPTPKLKRLDVKGKVQKVHKHQASKDYAQGRSKTERSMIAKAIRIKKYNLIAITGSLTQAIPKRFQQCCRRDVFLTLVIAS